jgi:hypothetical protein
VTREELEHAIRAACDVTGDEELYVFGSQAILGQFPEAPEALRQSAECDVALKNLPERLDLVDAVLGELSQFHQTYGFYVHGISLEAAELPTGWQKRAVKVQNANTGGKIGYCLEAHDLAASKLAAFRDKDRNFVRVLLVEDLVQQERLAARLSELSMEREARDRLLRWVERTTQEIKREESS